MMISRVCAKALEQETWQSWIVRHFALNLVRCAKDTKSIKLRRKMAAWIPNYLEGLLAHRLQ